MRTFLINLDRAEERLAFVDAQLRAQGVAYERVSGVDGRALTPDARRHAFNAFRWWCAVGRPVGAGEIGCALSHYNIYRRMQTDNIPLACILEDDVVFAQAFKSRLADLDAQIDASRPVVVMLSDHTHQYAHRTDEAPVLVRSSTAMCTDGYVITRPAAAALLAANLPIIVPCDHWWRWIRQGRIELYHSLPPVCSQNQTDFASNMLDCHVEPFTRPLSWRFLVHKASRLVGRTLDWILSAV